MRIFFVSLQFFFCVGMMFPQTLTAAEVDVPASGTSPLAALYRKCADQVVYMTGATVQPEKNEVVEFFKQDAGTEDENLVGSGFIIHPAGYVLTNAHSVLRSVVPVVELRNGSRYEAKVVALRRNQDLALVKFSSKEKLHPVEFAEAEDVCVGDPLAIIGAPYALKYTLTQGIISGTQRSSKLVDVPGVMLYGLLQTDAGINPGTSGGPWYDMRGKVIAITVSKRMDSESIGFGISTETLHRLLPDMLIPDLKTRFRVGFTPGLAKRESPQQPQQCWVTAVEEDAAAAKAGVRAGDVLQKLDGVAVSSPLAFYLGMLEKQPGDRVRLEMSRKDSRGVPMTFTVEFPLEKTPEYDAAKIIAQRLRIKVKPLTQEKAKSWNLRTADGVELMECDAEVYGNLDSPPQVGDVLVKVNYHRLRDERHLAEILDELPPAVALNLVFVRAEMKPEKMNCIRIDVKNLKIK